MENNSYQFERGAKYLFVIRYQKDRKIKGRKSLYIFEEKIGNLYKFKLLTITFPDEKPYTFYNYELISTEILDMHYITKISE
jgi:hypothetical protein